MAKQPVEPRDSEIVFGDLERSFSKLSTLSDNPAELRREFAHFVTLTQQLTEVYRNEYRGLTGKKWVAASFPGWTPITSLFKKLRRSNYHEHPFLIDVRHEQVVPFAKTSTGMLLAFGIESTTQLRDPSREDLPKTHLSVHLPGNDEKLSVAQERSRCVVRGRTTEVRKALTAAGTADVLELASSCLATLREYHAFYRTSVDSPGSQQRR